MIAGTATGELCKHPRRTLLPAVAPRTIHADKADKVVAILVHVIPRGCHVAQLDVVQIVVVPCRKRYARRVWRERQGLHCAGKVKAAVQLVAAVRLPAVDARCAVVRRRRKVLAVGRP